MPKAKGSSWIDSMTRACAKLTNRGRTPKRAHCAGRSFGSFGKGTSLNRNAAAVHLNRDLQIGSTLVVRNRRGHRTSVRVIVQLIAGNGVYTYGMEFLDQANEVQDFWASAFPYPEIKLTLP